MFVLKHIYKLFVFFFVPLYEMNKDAAHSDEIIQHFLSWMIKAREPLVQWGVSGTAACVKIGKKKK